MKKSNLFSFFARGATATHPLCSVFTIALLFVFCSFSLSVRADSSVSNIPVNQSWQFGQALDAYNSLSSEQKKICDFLVGAQGNAYAGLSNYSYQQAYNTFTDAISGVSNFGNKLWNNIKNAYYKGYQIGSGITNKLSSFLGSTVSYASSVNTSFDVWLGNIGLSYNSTSQFRIPYDPDITMNFINFFGDENLYTWQQTSSVILPNDFNIQYSGYPSMSGSQMQLYADYINSLQVPNVRGYNSSIYYRSLVYGSLSFNSCAYIFVNTTTRTVYFCNSDGTPASNFYADVVYTSDGMARKMSNVQVIVKTLNFNNYGTLIALFTALNNDPTLLIDSSLSYTKLSFADFVQGLYVGSSWDDKAPWTNTTDLNFAPVSNNINVYKPNERIYLDIIGFLQDLYDDNQTIKKSVEDNSVVSDGTPVPADIWDTISNYFTRPDSGIHIGTDFFKLPGSEFSIFDTYIADLWRGTKSFVVFCGDILNVFTLDGGGGLAYAVYGGIAVGVIGGIFSKFLL